jgi:hypothetical protein
MNKHAAINLVETTFEHPFDKDRFSNFARNLFHSFESASFIYRGNYIPDAYKKQIKTLERIGKYEDPEGNKIDILAVCISQESTLERARTLQRNFISWYLNGSRGDIAKDAALVAFYVEGSTDWRLSLVKMEYRLDKTEAGRLKTFTELTPAKRFSFLVGKNENTHTAQRQLLPILQREDVPPTLTDLEKAFSVEVVTKEFFEKYKQLFLDTKEALDKIIEADPQIQSDFKDKNIETVDFTKKLLGQIVFLYFLQKKGWFGVARDADWGSGPKEFLRLLFEKNIVDYDNYFNDILEPLFYEALAIERSGDFYSRFNCKIPFLNGGLFDPLNNYDWVHTDIHLPNHLFSNNYLTKEGDKGTGILDVFDRYNFTVKEDEPLEREVAVDPEMLGKVFENLLEVKDRKSKGTYYTPREIVHYMCQESLINYLVTELGGKVKKEDIETLVQIGEAAVEHDTRVTELGTETETYSYKLPASVRQHAKAIDEALLNIRVCDPAVGSGAFLVGMMTEIIRVRNTISSYLPEGDRSIYTFKHHAIQNSLYGVDIDPGATEIAKLRLWLSLIVDEQDIKRIKPLPNLDYKIMQGNSLLEEYEGIKLFDEELFKKSPFDNSSQIEETKEKFNELQSKFLELYRKNELHGAKKDEIEKELKKYSNKLKRLTKTPKLKTENRSLFDQASEAQEKAKELKRLHGEFFDTAQKKEKDRIKKNIERITWELIEATLREQGKGSLLRQIEKFKKTNTKPFFLWRLNFNEVFEDKGGFDVVIGNPPYLSAVQDSKNNGSSRDIYRKKYPLVKGAFDIYVIFLVRGIELLNKKSGVFAWIIPNKLLVAQYAEDVLTFLEENGLSVIVSASSIKVFDAGVYPILIFGNKFNKELKTLEIENLEDLRIKRFKERYSFDNRYKTFSESGIQFSSGATGFQAKMLIKYLSENPSSDAIPFVVSGSIDPYVIDYNNIRYMKKTYKKAFIQKGDEIADSKWSFWLKEKIVISGMTKRIEAVYINKPTALGVGVYAIHDYGDYHPLFLLGLLNSKFMTFYISTKFKDKHLAGGYLAINKSTLEKLPIVEVEPDKQATCARLVEQILSTIDSENYEATSSKNEVIRKYEAKIDQMVYELYDLSPEEIAIVEGGNDD